MRAALNFAPKIVSNEGTKPSCAACRASRISRSPSSENTSSAGRVVAMRRSSMSFCPPRGSHTSPVFRSQYTALQVKSRRSASSSILSVKRTAQGACSPPR